jgi:xylulokinase
LNCNADLLFERLRSKTDLSRIQAIGGSAVHAPIWLASTGQGPFPPLDPSLALYQQIYDQLTLSYVPLPADFTSHAPAMALEAALGGPDKMAYRVGITGHTSLLAAQIMRLREHNEEAWRRTHKVGTSNTFLEGIFSGAWSFSMEDAWLSGMWNIGSAKTAGGSSVNGRSTPSTSTPGWDKNASDYVAGGPVEGQHLRDSMGEVNTDTRSRTHPISRYWVDRYGFDPGMTLLFVYVLAAEHVIE